MGFSRGWEDRICLYLSPSLWWFISNDWNPLFHRKPFLSVLIRSFFCIQITLFLVFVCFNETSQIKLNCFSVAMIKYPDKGNLRENRFILAHSSRDAIHQGREDKEGRSGTHGNRNQKLDCHIGSTPRKQSENRKCSQAIRPQDPAAVNHFFQRAPTLKVQLPPQRASPARDQMF